MLSRNATHWLPDCCGTSRRNTTKRTIPERKTGRIAAQNATPGTPKHPLDLWQAHSVKKHSGCLPPICHQPLSAALADSPPIARPQRQIKRHPQPGHQAQTALGNSWKDCSCPKFFAATKNFAATGTAATMAPYATTATAGRQKEGNKKNGKWKWPTHTSSAESTCTIYTTGTEHDGHSHARRSTAGHCSRAWPRLSCLSRKEEHRA